ncbi:MULTISPECIES: RICIN domain-containing protein [Streptomyces]|uniref:Ricin B lectin domain-containing protein n=1 Tax=Streptomyces viridochromogenes TaxID=1938 RepID=A0A0L8JJP9_STRVR|nr:MULTISPECIES: RICIN domain-containing protein [Streptomyces]KOG13824.1 hypothetical protein ADK34_30190 [Streptomyces viridochromogenes]
MSDTPRRPVAHVAAAFGIVAARFLALGALSAGPAHAAVQYYEIRSPDGKCLSVAGTSQRSGADVVLRDCLGITDQRWRVTDIADRPIGELEDRPPVQQTDHILFVKLRAQHSDKCLALAGDRFEAGSDIVQADCSEVVVFPGLRSAFSLVRHRAGGLVAVVSCRCFGGGR